MAVGQRIKTARQKAGLTQKELGVKLGISYQTVAQWENNLRNPKQETLQKIAKALGVHLRDLSDSSMWEEFDQQHPGKAENAKRGLAVIRYLEEMGFTVSGSILKWHYEDQVDESGKIVGQAQIADEFGTVLSKDGYTATFTDAEFEELQAGAKEAIEGRFYKMVLKQKQNKK